MKMKKIFVLGSINIDLSINCEKFPVADETVIGKDFLLNTGGKGANQAVAAAKSGGNVVFLGATGDDLWGKKLRNNLEGYGVDCRHVVTKPCSSGIAMIIVSGGENRIIINPGANHHYQYEDFSEILKREAEPGDLFIAQLETRIEVVEKGLELAKSLGMVTILNPAPAHSLSDSVFASTDYLIPNEIEAFSLAGMEPDLNKLADVFHFFLSKKVKSVIITLGKMGCAYFESGKVNYVKAVPVEAIDTTAAGDTFVGSFAVKLLESGSIAAAVNYANSASALTTTKLGAQQAIPTKEEIDCFLNCSH